LPKELQEVWELSGNYKYNAEASNDAAWNSFEESTKKKVYKLTWVKYAAAAAIIIVCGLFAFNAFSNESLSTETFATKYGEIEVLELGDGSTVEIAPNSSISFTNEFGENTRTVALTGQAKFTVARDEDCPFIVKSDDLTTTVLGTVFEVRNDHSRNHQVVVHSGTVKVATATNEVLLTKNQSATYIKGELTKESSFSFNNWNGVNQELVYEDATLAQIQKDLKAMTGKTLVIPENKLNEKFTGKFNNSGDVATICKVLTEAFGFEITAILLFVN